MKIKNKVLLSLFISGLVLFLGMALTTAEAAVQEYQKRNVSLTWNRPIRDSQVVPGELIEFSGSLYITSCFNTIDIPGNIKFYISDQQYPDDPEVLNNLGTYISSKDTINFSNTRRIRETSQSVSEKIRIPSDFEGDENGYAYIRVYFSGRFWHQDFVLVASERVIIVGPDNRPTADNLEANLITDRRYGFSWDFHDPNGQNQFAYQVQVSPTADFSTIKIDSGAVRSSSRVFTPPVSLNWGTRYYWRINVWNDQGLNSGWVNGPYFDTLRHAFPDVDFHWTPADPNIYEEVTFIDDSTVYGGATKSSWEWTFEGADVATSDQESPVVHFNSAGSKTITLQLTDSSGYNKTKEKTINIQLAPPEWQEVSSD